MAAGNEIAKLFGTLGFKVDTRGVKQFERTMSHLEKRMKGLGQAQNKAMGNGRNSSTRGVTKQASAVERLTSRYDKFGGALQRIRNDMQRTNQLYKSGNISAEKRNNLLNQMAYQYDKVAKAKARYQRYGDRDKGRPKHLGPQIRGGMTGFVPGFGGGFAAMQSVQSYQQSVGMEQALTSATGDAEKAADDMDYLIKQSRRLGMFIGDVGRSFANMTAAARGTSLAGEEVRHVFEGISSQARVLNLSAADTQGIFRAVTQIMNKQQVMAEELKNQLGERMPGAIQATARAMDMVKENGEADTQALFKAMENGELVAEDVLPKLSDEMLRMSNTGGALEKAMNNTSAAIARFRTNLWLANRTYNESGFDQSVRNLFNTMSDAIMKADPLWEILGRSSEIFGNALRAPIAFFGELSEKLSYFTDQQGPLVSEKMKSMGAAIMFAVRPLRKLLFWFGILPAAFTFAKNLLDKGFDTSSWEELAIQIGTIALALGMIAPRLKKVANGIRSVTKSTKSLKKGNTSTTSTSASAGSSTASKFGKTSLESLRQQSSRMSWSNGNSSYGLGRLGGLTKGIGSKGLGALGLGLMAKDGYENFMDSNLVKSLTGRVTDLELSAYRQYGVGTPFSPDTMQSVNAVSPNTAPQVNGDIVFNVETNDPEEFLDIVNGRMDEIFRGAATTNPVNEK